jgi:ABC-type transporter Mla subunit MlaD
VVNQLYWRHRQAFERLLASGERFRKAQAAQLTGKASNLKAALEARREALSELSKLAAGILRESRHPVSPEMQRRITTTLEALSTYGSHPDAPMPGRLTADVDPPGFEALASLVPQAGGSGRPKTSKVLPFKDQGKRRKDRRQRPHDEKRQREAARAAARRAVRDAERVLKAARKAGEQAEAALKRAAARAKSAESAKERMEKQMEKVTAAADAARQAARKVAAQAEDAAQVLADAERALEQARQELNALG